jgi:hypothetical protein
LLYCPALPFSCCNLLVTSTSSTTTFLQAAHEGITRPSAVSSTSSCSSPKQVGFKDFHHQQGTDLGGCLGGSYLLQGSCGYVVSTTPPSLTACPHLPTAPASLLPLQKALLCLLANASGSPIARQLAIFTYLAIGEVAVRKILQQEEAAAATLARYARLAAKAEERKVSSSGRHSNSSTADCTACLLS